MGRGAFGLVGEALKFGVGQGARNFAVLSVLMLLGVGAGWGAVYVLRPGSGFEVGPQRVFPALWGCWALLFVCAVAALHRAAFLPEERLPYVPVLARPRGRSLFDPLRMGLGHAVPLVLSFVVIGWAPAAVTRVTGLSWMPFGYAVTAGVILGVFWLSARLLTYPAQIAAERRLDPRASLRASRGRTGPFLIALLAAWGLFAVLTALYAALCGYLVLPLSGGEIGTVDQLSLPYLVVLVIVLMIYVALALGFWAGLSAAAYRASAGEA